MTDTVVIALPYFRHDAERIAAFLGADIAPYTPEIFAEVFLQPETDRCPDVDGDCCPEDRPAA